MFSSYEDLAAEFPEDAVCAFCGRENTHWDQDGFFYLWVHPEDGELELEDGLAACKECCEGEPGKTHERLHGKGVRG